MDDAKSNTAKAGFKLTQAKQVVRFFCLFVLVYVLLMAPWPGLKATYSKVYRAGAAFLFKSFGSRGVVRFRPLSGDAKHDTTILFYHRDRVGPDGKMVAVAHMRHSSRRHGYICTAFLTALILASPIPFRRRARALLWAMVLIHAFIAFKMGMWILYGFSHEPLSLFVLSPFWKRVFLLTIHMFIRNLTFGLIVSVFIWILVSFRRDDWAGILTQNKGESKVETAK